MKPKIWQDESYYKEAQAASETIYPALTYLKDRYIGKDILEVGCGEGTKLKSLSAKKRTGVDISPVAIKLAQKKLDVAVVSDVTSLPFKNKSFDAVLSFFSLEHFFEPEKALNEMARVLKQKGELVIVTPNFGAPNRSSPCFVGSRGMKLIKGFIADLFPSKAGKLDFHHVEPLSEKMAYVSDYDTLVEPYSRSLAKYLVSHGFNILKLDTMWNIESKNDLSTIQKIFFVLGNLRVFPFHYWGPHIFLIAQKQ